MGRERQPWDPTNTACPFRGPGPTSGGVGCGTPTPTVRTGPVGSTDPRGAAGDPRRARIAGAGGTASAYRGGRGGDRQAFLSLWAVAPIKVDRKGQESIFITEPVVSVTGGVQPEMLGELAEAAGRRDGFLERILWSFPEKTTVT
jgi:hypothetical protein